MGSSGFHAPLHWLTKSLGQSRCAHLSVCACGREYVPPSTPVTVVSCTEATSPAFSAHHSFLLSPPHSTGPSCPPNTRPCGHRASRACVRPGAGSLGSSGAPYKPAPLACVPCLAPGPDSVSATHTSHPGLGSPTVAWTPPLRSQASECCVGASRPLAGEEGKTWRQKAPSPLPRPSLLSFLLFLSTLEKQERQFGGSCFASQSLPLSLAKAL